MPRLYILALLLAALIFGGGAGYRWGLRQQIPVLAHPVERLFAIRQQARSFPKNGIVLLGDSITEQAYIPALCGVPVLDAGIAGARLADVAPLVAELSRAADPRVIVLLIGTNDALTLGDVAAWRGLLHDTIATLGDSTRVFLAVPPPVAATVRHAAEVSAALDQIRGTITAEAAAGHLGIIDLRQALGDTALPPELTVDGIHLSPAGYRIWQSVIAAAVCPALAPHD